jgi:O-antigen/teichoic acid export membrane protein
MRENSSAIHVARGASFVIVQNIGSTVIQITAFAIIARLISQADMGILATLSLTVGLSSTATSLGLAHAATKFIAEHIGIGDRKGATSIFYQILKVRLVLSVAAAFFCFFFSEQISLFLLKTANYAGLFRVLALDIIPSGIFPSLYNSLIGLQKIREATIFNLLRLVIRQIIFVSLLLLGFGLLGLVVAWFIGDLINVSLYLSVIFGSLGSPTFSFSLKRLLKFSYPLYFGNLVSFAYSWFDRILLLASLPLSALGVYDVTFRAFGVLSSITLAISTALFPKYSELHSRNGIRSVENGILIASRYICYITMPLAFGLLAVAQPAITLFAGESYGAGSQPLMILSFFFAIVCLQTAFSGILLVLEETLIVSGLTVANVVVGIIFGASLLPSFGIIGASIARGITMVASLLLSIWVLRKKINLKLDKEAFWKSLLSSAIMAVVVGGVEHLWYDTYLLPFYLMLGAFVYLGMLRILKASRDKDIELLRLYLGKRFEFLMKPIEFFLVVKEQPQVN